MSHVCTEYRQTVHTVPRFIHSAYTTSISTMNETWNLGLNHAKVCFGSTRMPVGEREINSSAKSNMLLLGYNMYIIAMNLKDLNRHSCKFELVSVASNYLTNLEVDVSC